MLGFSDRLTFQGLCDFHALSIDRRESVEEAAVVAKCKAGRGFMCMAGRLEWIPGQQLALNGERQVQGLQNPSVWKKMKAKNSFSQGT